ncbi:MAG: tryptophan synthase subunit alpha, partial [Acidimicrobiales bacterium]
MTGPLEAALRRQRDRGRKLLVPYVTGGMGDWADVVRAAAAAGADAVEVGIPFSDPVMDGPVIQEASQRALAAGATPPAIVADLGRLDVEIPLAVMTYYNLVFRGGLRRFAR